MTFIDHEFHSRLIAKSRVIEWDKFARDQMPERRSYRGREKHSVSASCSGQLAMSEQFFSRFATTTISAYLIGIRKPQPRQDASFQLFHFSCVDIILMIVTLRMQHAVHH